jgi:hypothetical protein
MSSPQGNAQGIKHRHPRQEDSSPSYYFINDDNDIFGNMNNDNSPTIEELPHGFKPEQFSPKVVNSNKVTERKTFTPVGRHRKRPEAASTVRTPQTQVRRRRGIWSRLLYVRTKKTHDPYAGGRKIDPKVYFSIERTYLAWMHTSLMLAGISLAIMAYSEEGDTTAIYGLMLLPIAIVFCVYSMYQCKYQSEFACVLRIMFF